MNAVELVQPFFDLSGRRVLFVSNRTDPELERRLLSTLNHPELEWLEIAPRQTQAAAERVEAGRYDLVLAQTKFIDHSVDGALSGSCKAVGVPYLRVDKGRPAVVVAKLTSHFRDGAPVAKVRKHRVSSGARWSGAELWHLEQWRKEGLAYADISARLREQFGVERGGPTINQAWVSYFSPRRGKNARALPQDYYDVKQAMEHRARIIEERTVEHLTAPEERPVVAPILASVAKPSTILPPAQLALAGSTAMSITSSKDGQLTVEIRGTKGNALVETTRTLAEVMAFLVV